MLAHLSGHPVGLREARKDVPEALERVIAKSLAHLPEGRFASMAEFGEALGKTQ